MKITPPTLKMDELNNRLHNNTIDPDQYTYLVYCEQQGVMVDTLMNAALALNHGRVNAEDRSELLNELITKLQISALYALVKKVCDHKLNVNNYL